MTGNLPSQHLVLPPLTEHLLLLIRKRSLHLLWMCYGARPSNTTDYNVPLTLRRSMSFVSFSNLRGTRIHVLVQLPGLVPWVTLSRHWSALLMSGRTWKSKRRISPGDYPLWTLPARGPQPTYSPPLPMCWPAKEILSIPCALMGFWKWYGNTDSGQPPLPFLSGSTSTIVLVSLPRFAGPCWPRPVLSGAMTPASAKSLLSVPLGPLFKCTSRAAIVTWSGLTYKPPYSGPFTHCTSQIDHSRMIWYRWRFSSRKGSRVSPEQPLAVPLLSRIGRRCCEKKAAEFIPVETRIIWSSMEFTRQLKRFAQFLNLLSSISFLLTQMNRNIQELLSLRSSHLDLSSLVPVIGPRLPGCGIFWTCVVVRKGGSSITTIDGSDIKEFRFTMGTSLPANERCECTPLLLEDHPPTDTAQEWVANAPLQLRGEATGPAPSGPSGGACSARNDASPMFETTGDPLLLIGRRGGHRGHDDRVVSFDLDAFQ